MTSPDTAANRRPEFRPLCPADHGILLEAILANVTWNDEVFSLANIIGNRELSRYGDLDPRRGDFGILLHADNRWIAVVWLLFLPGSDPGYGYVADGVPELALCVRKQFRRRGLGRELLTRALVQAAARDLDGVSLSVAADNPARYLYTSCGFAIAGERGGSLVMFADRSALAAAATEQLY